LIKEGTLEQLNTFTLMYYNNLPGKPFHNLFKDVMKNWFSFTLIFIKQLIKEIYKYFNRILARQKTKGNLLSNNG